MQMSRSTAKKNEYKLFNSRVCTIQYLGRYVAAQARISILSPSPRNALAFLEYGDGCIWELLFGPNQGADAFDASVRGMRCFCIWRLPT